MLWDTGWVLWLILPLTTCRVLVMQYGQYGGLNLKCGRDELIFVQSELLGFSQKPGSCEPRPLCSVPYTLAKWFCRGKSSCTGMQVERRPLHRRTCGSDFTNCLRVEYECVKRSMLTDICSSADFSTSHGFIASPKFPLLYPPNQNCSCTLESDETVHLHSAFFLLRSSAPCKDWLSIKTEKRQEKKRCGYVPEQRPSFGHSIQLNFHSDRTSQDMGFWMPFFGANANATVRVRCGTALAETTTLTAITPSTETAATQDTKETNTTPMTPQSREKNEEFVTDLSLLELDMMYFDQDANDSTITNESKKTAPKDNRVVKNLDYEYYPLYYDYDQYYDEKDEDEYSSTIQHIPHTSVQPTTPIHYTVTEPAQRNVDSTTPTMGIQILNPVDDYKLTPQILSALEGLKHLDKKSKGYEKANEFFDSYQQHSRTELNNINLRPVTISHMGNKMLRPETKTIAPEIEEPLVDKKTENSTNSDHVNSTVTILETDNANDTDTGNTTAATTEEQTLVAMAAKVVDEKDAKEMGESPEQPPLPGPSIAGPYSQLKTGPYNWLPFLLPRQPNTAQTPPTPITIYDSNLIQITLKGNKPNNSLEKLVPWLHIKEDEIEAGAKSNIKSKEEEIEENSKKEGAEKPGTKTTPTPETTYPFNWFDLKQWKGNSKGEDEDEKDPYKEADHALEEKKEEYDSNETEKEFVRKDLWKYITTRRPPSPPTDKSLVLVLPDKVVDEMGKMKANKQEEPINKTVENEELLVQHGDAREGEDIRGSRKEFTAIPQHSPPGFFQYYQNLQEQRFLAQQQMLHQLQEQLLQQQIQGRQDTSKDQLLQLQQLREQQQQLYLQRQQQLIRELQLQQKFMQQQMMRHETIAQVKEVTPVTDSAIKPKEGQSPSEYTTMRPTDLEPATHFLDIFGPQNNQQQIKMTSQHENPRQAIPFKDYLMLLREQEEKTFPQQPVPSMNDQMRDDEVSLPKLVEQNEEISLESKPVKLETVPISSPPIEELRIGNEKPITKISNTHNAETDEQSVQKEEVSNSHNQQRTETEHKLIGINPFHRMMGPMDLPTLIDPNEEIYAKKRQEQAQNLRSKNTKLQAKEFEDTDYEEKLGLIGGILQISNSDHQTETAPTATTQYTTETTTVEATNTQPQNEDKKWEEQEILLQQILKERLRYIQQQQENAQQQRQNKLLLQQQHFDEQKKQEEHLQQQLRLRLEQQVRESLLQERQKWNLQQQEEAHQHQNQIKRERERILHQQQHFLQLQEQKGAKQKPPEVTIQKEETMEEDLGNINGSDSNTSIQQEIESQQHEKQESHKEMIIIEQKIAQNKSQPGDRNQHGAQKREKNSQEAQPRHQTDASFFHPEIKHYEELMPFFSLKQELNTKHDIHTEQPPTSRKSEDVIRPDNYKAGEEKAAHEQQKNGWQQEIESNVPLHKPLLRQENTERYETVTHKQTKPVQDIRLHHHQTMSGQQQSLQPTIASTLETSEYAYTPEMHTEDRGATVNHLPILIDANEQKYSEISESLEFIPPWKDGEEMQQINMLGDLAPDFTPQPQSTHPEIEQKFSSRETQSVEKAVIKVLSTDDQLQTDAESMESVSETEESQTKATKYDTESSQIVQTVKDERKTTLPPTTIKDAEKSNEFEIRLPYTLYNKPYKGGSYYNREYLLPKRKLLRPKEGSDGPAEELPEELSLPTTTKRTAVKKEDIEHHNFFNVVVTERPVDLQILEDVEIKLVDKTFSKQETRNREKNEKKEVKLKTKETKKNFREEIIQDTEDMTDEKEIQPKETFKKVGEMIEKTYKDKTHPPDYYRAKQAEKMRENSITQKEGPQRKPKELWPKEYRISTSTTPMMKWGPTLDPDAQRIHSAVASVKHPVMKEKMPNSLQDLMQTDPEMYKRIQSYMAEREAPVEAAIEAKKEEATDDMNKNTVWMLVVIAVVGWIVFVVLLSLLVYNKRKGYCQRRRRKNSFSNKLRPRLAQHLLHHPVTHISSPRPLNKPDLSMLNKALMPLSTDVITHNRSRDFDSETRIKGRRTNRSKEEDSRSESSQSSKENREDSMEDRPLPPLPRSEHPTPGPSAHKRPKHGSVGGSTSSAYESLDKYEQKNKRAQQPRVKQWNTIASIKAYTGLSQMMLQEAREGLNPVKVPPWEKQLRRGYMGKGFRPNEDEVHPVTKAAVPHSFTQQSTPFLAIKRNQSETDSDSPVTEKRKAKESESQRLKGRKVNSMSSWKSITTLDTQNTGDGEEVYNQLQTIANTFDSIADSVSSGSPHSTAKRPRPVKDQPPPIPPKSPLIKTGLSYPERHGMTHYPSHMKRDCVDKSPRNVTTIRTPTINL